MFQIATITSKRQLTIPSKIFKQMDLKEGDKLVLSQDGQSIKLVPALKLVNRLSGSVAMPARFRGKSLDQIIAESKKEHFKDRE